MELIKTIEDMIRFKTETGNMAEIERCLDYIVAKFKNTNAYVRVERFAKGSPVLYLANNNSEEQDAVVLGHIDVVKAKDEMFVPVIRDGKMYGRGTLDMKSFAVVAMHTMAYVLEHNLPIKFAVILSTDEETSGGGMESFLEEHPHFKAQVVLDNDVGGDIGKIINKCKNPVHVILNAKGKQAHGSTPWEGLDANEMLMRTITNLRHFYPYFDVNTGAPANKWLDTMHVAMMSGGEVSNIIAGHASAHLDFRLTETSTLEGLMENLTKCLAEGVSYQIESSSVPVVMSEKNPFIVSYKKLAEKTLGRTLDFEQIGGATDSRLLALRGATVIMHSGDGEGMHGDGEYVVLDTVEKLADLQIRFLEELSQTL